MKNSIKIQKRLIGPDFPPLIIPEIGINHEGDYDKAIELVDAAIKSGAEIVKFQTHITNKEMIKTDMKPGNISDETLWDIIERCELTEQEEISIQKYCIQKNIIYLSTPFSREASDRLEKMNVPAYKIGSGECNNHPLLHHIASKKKPIILSTGMNSMESIMISEQIIRSYGCPLALLHCTSMYPTPYENVRLGAIQDLKDNFSDLPIGSSDHSLGIATSLGAVAIGASIIEKHFTISRDWPGPDTSISIEPNELEALIEDSMKIWRAKGGTKTILDEEKPVINFAYASVVSIKNIKINEVFTTENIWVKRPGNGTILSDKFKEIIGKKAKKNIRIDQQITPEDIEDFIF